MEIFAGFNALAALTDVRHGCILLLGMKSSKK
jgi:hypothetical protein